MKEKRKFDADIVMYWIGVGVLVAGLVLVHIYVFVL